MNDDRQVEIKHHFLSNRRIALVVSASIASVESIKLIRQLRRFGAEVQVYLSKNAQKFVQPLTLEWASLSKPITSATAKAEHIFHHDILLVAPASFDIIAKSALGVCDSHVTTLIASALGRKQEKRPGPAILFAPAMHSSLAANPFLNEHIKKLSAAGAIFIASLREEKKLKLKNDEEIAWQACHADALSQNNALSGKKIFINAGSVPSFIDEVRMLSNIGSAETGIALAYTAYAMGAEPSLLLPKTSLQKHSFPFESHGFDSFEDFQRKTIDIIEKQSPDLAVFSAAVSDYKVKQAISGKISSDTNFDTLQFTATPKVISSIRKKFPKLLMSCFKLVSGLSENETKQLAKQLVQEKGCQIVIANRLEDIKSSWAKNDASSATIKRCLAYNPTEWPNSIERSHADGVLQLQNTSDLAKALFSFLH